MTAAPWDVIIIGSGLAGSTLALILSRCGVRVLLVDQSPFPRTKVCGGYLNANALAALACLGLSRLPGQLGGEPIQSLHLASRNRSALLPLPAGVCLTRSALDMALIHECIESGVAFRPGARATMREVDGNTRCVELRTKSETVLLSARIVVLAYGLQSGAVSPNSWIGAGAILESPPSYFPERTISMALGDGGYVGAVRVEQGRFTLAAALDPRLVKTQGSLAAAVSCILQQAGQPAISGLVSAEWKGTPFLTRRPDELAGPRWFAVGDAAGYVEPFTGEGMAWAMNGALALAPIVARAVGQWGDSEARLWRSTYARVVRRRQWPCRVLARVLHSPRQSAALVCALSFFPVLAMPYLRTVGSRRGVAA